MPTRVTITLDSGAFLLDESKGKNHLDVGYFETPGIFDIEVFEDASPIQLPGNKKLGRGNNRIDVEHLEADKKTVKKGVNRTASFDKDLMVKKDLYKPAEVPDFIVAAYDCILRFHSGTFESADVTERRFTEHLVSDDSPTGNSKMTRPIANDILVQYDLGKNETVRLRRHDGTDAWSSDSAGSGTKLVEVRILAGSPTNASYHKKALKHVGPHYYLPNSDPPPMDSHGGG